MLLMCRKDARKRIHVFFYLLPFLPSILGVGVDIEVDVHTMSELFSDATGPLAQAAGVGSGGACQPACFGGSERRAHTPGIAAQLQRGSYLHRPVLS